MSGPDINFRNIRKHRSSQNDGFEELTRQLVLAEPPEGAIEIENRGPGADGGVEILVRFADRRVWGWQSKYFTDGFDTSEVKQLKKSFSAALENFPTLERYYVAIPRNLSGHAEGDNNTQTKHWKNFKTWCDEESSALERTVEIFLWDDTYLVSRLQRRDPVHAGMRLYWFNETVLDQEWFQRQLDKSLAFIGNRYRPTDHVDVRIGATLEIMTKGREFVPRLDAVWSAITACADRLRTVIALLDKDDKHLVAFQQTIALLVQLVETSKATDPRRLADHRIAALLTELRELETQDSVDFVINRARYLKREIPQGAVSARERHVYSSEIRNILEGVRSEISSASRVFSIQETKLFQTSSLLIEGEAGIGKSHIIALEVHRHVQAGFPGVFVPGRTLEHGDKPESEILEYLDLPDLRFDTFLGALDAAAKASGRPALLAIDGINETLDAAGWEPGLPKLIAQIRQFGQIGFCASIRSAYRAQCIRPGLDIVTVRHVGFSSNYGEAAREYLDHHGIERPSAPIFELRDILYNPLFLTTAVDFLNATHQSSFPRGLDSIGEVIEFWLNAIEINLTTKRYDRISRHDGKIVEAARAIATKMAEVGSEYLDFKIASDICEEIIGLGFPTKAADRFLLKLMDEGMLLDTPDDTPGKPGKLISFAFQKFSDYFIADAVLRQSPNLPVLAASIKPGGKFHYLFDKETPWKFAGPRSALFALTALRFGKELPDIEADITDHVFFSASDFLDSLQWRQGNAILEDTRELLEALHAPMKADDEAELSDEDYFDLLLRLAAIPKCRLNALYLKKTLAAMTMAERDAVWSLYLVGKTETYDEEWPIVQELVNWSWTAPPAPIASETVHLIAIVMSLMTSTMDREVRDSATKALSSLLIKFPSEISPLLDEFSDWDDAYVRERVLAAAMAGTLYCADIFVLRSAAEAADRMVFAKRPIERHAWVRRYAQIIVLHANLRGADLTQDLVKRATPPYASPAIAQWPSLAELAPLYEGAREIFSSVIGYLSEKDGSKLPMMAGDFGRYTMSGIDNSFSAESRGTEAPMSRDTAIELFWSNVEGTIPQAASLRGDLEHARALKTESSMTRLLARLDLDEDNSQTFGEDSCDMEARATSDGDDRHPFEKIYDELESLLIEMLTPDLRDRYRELDPLAVLNSGQIEKFSILTARYWIFDRVMRLGWDKMIHEPIERHNLRYSSGRHDHQIERIGKKYQHIALQELIGYLTDHHWYLDWNSPASVLMDLELFKHADIDPTYLAGDFSRDPSTFFPNGLAIPEMKFEATEPRQDMEWTKTPVDLPDPVPFLVQRDTDGEQWYLQKCFTRSLGYMDDQQVPEPFRKAQLSVELVLFKIADVAKLEEISTASLKGDDWGVFDNGRETHGFYGQRSALHATDQTGVELHHEIAGIKFGRFVDSYTPKFGEYDRSGIAGERSFSVPARALLSSQNLRQNDAWSTFYVSDDGKPAFAHGHDHGFDGVTAVRADVMKRFAEENDLKPVWIVWAEKDGGKSESRSAGEEHFFARNDFLGLYYEVDGMWSGKFIRFRAY